MRIGGRAEGQPGSLERSLDRWGRDANRSLIQALFESAYHNWFRVEWEGLENLPTDGGALLVANHAGLMPVDGGLIQLGIENETDRPVYMLAHHGFFLFPFLGRVLNRTGIVVAHPDNAHRLLSEDGHLVVVFPEGEKGPVKPRSEKHRLQRFGRGGFIETAMRADVPIVPIVLMGTEDATPTIADLEIAGRKVPLTLNTALFGPVVGSVAFFPAKIKARVLPSVQFEKTLPSATPSRSLLMDRAEAIREEMQIALDDMLEKRGDIWFG
jgi:1-acyl-sn-glycerol-3-phosphate acyltransferase